MKVGNSVRYAGAAAAVAGLAALGLVAIAGPSALAQTPPPLKIGVMDGFSGVYGDLTAGEVALADPDVLVIHSVSVHLPRVEQ